MRLPWSVAVRPLISAEISRCQGRTDSQNPRPQCPSMGTQVLGDKDIYTDVQ